MTKFLTIKPIFESSTSTMKNKLLRLSLIAVIVLVLLNLIIKYFFDFEINYNEEKSSKDKILIYTYYTINIFTYLLITILIYNKFRLDQSNSVNNEAYIGQFSLKFLALLWIPNILMSFSVRQELQPDPQIIYTLLFAPISWLFVLINNFVQSKKKLITSSKPTFVLLIAIPFFTIITLYFLLHINTSY